MKKIILFTILTALLVAFFVVPISASVSVSTPSADDLKYNRNNIRYHSYNTYTTALTRPLPTMNYLNIAEGEGSHKTVTTTNDNCAYTVDVYPRQNTYISVMGLYFYSPTTYYATFNNTFLQTSYRPLNPEKFDKQYPNLNGFYVYSNTTPTYNYSGEVYVITADYERYILDLEKINSYITPVDSPYQSQGSLLNKQWIYDSTYGSSSQGAIDMLSYTYLIEPSATARCFYIPSLTEVVNLYFRDNFKHVEHINGDKTLSIYTKDCSLHITTDISLYIVSQYTDYEAPQNQSFSEYPERFYESDFLHAIFDNLDTEFAYGMSITDMAYIVVAIVCLGYILKLIGGG